MCNSYKTILLNKLEQKDFVVGVIGLGYVGLPLVLSFSECGFRCIGFDINEEKINSLISGTSYIHHIPSERVKGALNDQRFQPTTDFSLLSECDAILIALPTPLSIHREPDLSYVKSGSEIIAGQLRKGQLVVLESTTYPGTCNELIAPILAKSGLEAEKDYFLAFSPEREDPSNPDFNTRTIPKVVGANSEDGLVITTRLYQSIIVRVVPVSSTKVAEAAKLFENIFRAVNIALVNEMKIILSKMDIDVWEVIQAASSKPFGFMPFYPGPGLGGHCVPIDPFYLAWKAREYDASAKFIELAGEINTAMPDYVVEKVVRALNDTGKPLIDSRILMLGLAYKPDVDDPRESPSFVLMDKLEILGARVEYNDPYIPIIPLTRKYPHLAGRQSVEIGRNFDLILISTAHSQYRSIDFMAFDKPIVDTRNIVPPDTSKLYKA